MNRLNKRFCFPEFRAQLLKLAQEDQAMRKSPKPAASDQHYIAELLQSDQRRAQRVLEILEVIKNPSVDNIGLDGSRAVWLIAQHNADFKDLGNKVLKKMSSLYRKNKSQVYYQGIPYLTDRLMILEQLTKGIDKEKSSDLHLYVKQLYGTQYRRTLDGKLVRFKVVSPESLPERRKAFGLVDSINYE